MSYDPKQIKEAVNPPKPRTPLGLYVDELIKFSDAEIEKLKAMGMKMTTNGGCEHEVRARLIVKILDGNLPFEIRRIKTYPPGHPGASKVQHIGLWRKAPMSAAHYFDPDQWDMRLAELQPRTPVRVKMGPDDLPTPCFIKARNAGAIGVVTEKNGRLVTYRMPGDAVTHYVTWEHLFASGSRYLWSDRAERPHREWKSFSKPHP